MNEYSTMYWMLEYSCFEGTKKEKYQILRPGRWCLGCVSKEEKLGEEAGRAFQADTLAFV